jgi:thymidylate synthase
MNTHDETYLGLLKRVLNEGKTKKNRTGIDTIGVFGAQARFDLAEGFPLLTTKKVFFKGIVHELLWFISGSTNIKYLVDNDVHIWDDWAYQRYLKFVSKIVVMGGIDKTILSQEDFIHRIKTVDEFAKIWGELGTGTYGGMWRAFPFYNDYDTVAPVMEERDALDSVDQLKRVIEKLKSNPDDRRLIVSAWHPYWVEHCALPPCHVLFHFNTEVMTLDERYEHATNKAVARCGPETQESIQEMNHKALDDAGVPRRKLNCLLYQRSCDLFLGVPFNIASYALLTHMVAHCVGMVPGEFIHTYGDLHLYRNHVDQAKLQLTRAPFPSPHVSLNLAKRDLFHFNYDDIQLFGYNSHPAIKADVAV